MVGVFGSIGIDRTNYKKGAGWQIMILVGILKVGFALALIAGIWI
jgi:hypothetical protein